VVRHDVQLYSCRNQFVNHVIEILCIDVFDAVGLCPEVVVRCLSVMAEEE
jgi:hypothetical protein